MLLIYIIKYENSYIKKTYLFRYIKIRKKKTYFHVISRF